MQNFDSIYRENAEIVYRYIFSLSQDSELAEEVTQQTFYETLRHADNYRGESSVSTYLCGVAGKLLKKELSRRNRNSHLPLDDAENIPSSQNTESSVSGTLSRADLFQRIHDLPETMREVVYIRLSGELSFREIGEILGHSENWARVTFYRAKQKLMEGDDR